MDNNIDNFLHLERLSDVHIQGIGNGLAVQGIGTVQYSFITDSGAPLDVIIKDVLLVEESPMILLCPQQLA